MTRSASRRLTTPKAPPRPAPASSRPPLHSETRWQASECDLDLNVDLDLDSSTETSWPPPLPTAPPSVRARPGAPKRLSPPAIVRPLAEPPPAFSIVVLDSSKPIEDSLSVDEARFAPDVVSLRRSRTGKVVAGVTFAAVAVLGVAELIFTFG